MTFHEHGSTPFFLVLTLGAAWQIMEAVESTLSLLDISLVADSIVIPPPGSGVRGVSGG